MKRFLLIGLVLISVSSFSQDVLFADRVATGVNADTALLSTSKVTYGTLKKKVDSLGAGKQATLVSNTNIKTVNGTSLLGSGDVTQTTVTGNAGTTTALQTSRNINGVAFNGTADITITASSLAVAANSTDADYTAVVNTVKHLPASTLTANRTITIPTGSNGDYIEIYNNEAGFSWLLGGATVYLADQSTTVTQLLYNTVTQIKKVDGKWTILN